MRSRVDSSFTVWAVLPPTLVDRFSERILSDASHRLLSDKAFLSGVMRKANELEPIVFDGESSSWGPWPLWLDDEGLEYCGAIGLILGFRLRALLEDQQIDCGFARTAIESLIEDKARSDRREGGWA
jgi:hypothetical protein